jgi:hypothetical protein
MTYGVDQCRCCGVGIEGRGPEAMREYEESLRRPPTMPEAKWRRLGYLAAPTRQQMNFPQYGCCPNCAERELRRFWKPFTRLMWVLLAAFAVGGLLFFMVNYIA